ncbi:MAG: sulfite exporter TauE/SafE family protein [Candidatus Thermoplasmatota archaeon]|nr:sulfite exporter TauE/SafE family protein [Candidatus Thermoplasmatota archaeon]
MPLLILLTALLKFISIIVAGIFAGLLGSLTGLGGGTVLVPVLTLFYGIPFIFAAGASLISTIATSAGSASAYVKEKIANIKIGVGLEVATTTGAIVGSITLAYINHVGLIWTVYVIFGAVLLGSLVPTIQRTAYEVPPLKKPDWTTRIFQLKGTYHDQRLKKDVDYIGIRWWLGEIIMFFAGFVSGLLGIGSGALKVVGMDWAMNLPLKVTTTTSNFMIGITAATSSSIYWFEGFIQPFIAAATAVGVIIGAYFGAKILVKITNRNIRWIFFWILLFLGIDMVLKGLYIGDIFTIISLFYQFFIAVGIATFALFGLIHYFSSKSKKRGETKT